jgi:uncharacterized protein YcfJ
MKTAAISGAVIAALAAGAISTPSFARDYCHERQHNSGTTGALVGGLAGAVIGSNVAGHGSRTGGTIIGGLAGAAIGNNIGRSSVKCDRYGYYDRHQYSSTYRGYYDGRYGYNDDYNRAYYDNRYYNGYTYYPYD